MLNENNEWIRMEPKPFFRVNYIANTKVLVPIYNDPNDKKALAIIQSLFPKREVVGIDATQLYEFGGMIHCITQQQPAKPHL